MDHESKIGKAVTIYVTQGMLRANVIRGLLESAGIPVSLKYEAAGPAIGMIIDDLGRVAVQVPATFEQEARDLLEAVPATDAAAEDSAEDIEEEPDDAPDEG